MYVVVGIDGSKYGQWAMDWIPRLPFAKPPRVTVVHAIDIGALRAPFVIQPAGLTNVRFLERETAQLVVRGKGLAQDAKRRLEALEIRGRVVLSRGAPASVILKHAKPRGLVIVGHRGLDAVDRVMLGSVSGRIVRQSPCSVLIVKEAARPLHRIVLAIDGSAPSHKAVHFLTASVAPGARRQIEVVVCHVMPFLRYPELKTAAQRMVRHVADKLVKAGYPVVEAPKLGHPADEIITLADREAAHLIVVGARGHGAVARLLLGSVSVRVLDHARASVLIVR